MQKTNKPLQAPSKKKKSNRSGSGISNRLGASRREPVSVGAINVSDPQRFTEYMEHEFPRS